MEGIVICDLRFLRDIYEIGLLDKVFALPISFHTSDFVFDYITPEECAQKCKTLRENGTFIVDTIPGSEFEKILECRKKGLSFDDATVWYIARKFNLGLLTDDYVLKRHLVEDSKKVIGIVDILDLLVSSNLINQKDKDKALCGLKKLGREL